MSTGLLPWSRLPCDVSDDARRAFVRYALGTREIRELAILSHVLPETIEAWAVAGQWAARTQWVIPPEQRAVLAAELAAERDERAAQAAALRTAREFLGREWARLAAPPEPFGEAMTESDRTRAISALARATAAVFPEARAGVTSGPARALDFSRLSDAELDLYLALERKATAP